jgi:4'-phosphopantetheinyl transferase
MKRTIDVWFESFSNHSDGVSSLEPLLSPGERAKAGTITEPIQKRNYILSRAILRQILSRYTDRNASELRFSYGSFGKPALTNSSIHFNVSHSRDLFVCAVDRESEVGVDVEYIEDVGEIDSISAQSFTVHERLQLARCHPNNRLVVFFQLWTRKEAFLKATGHGLTHLSEKLDVLLSSHDSLCDMYSGIHLGGVHRLIFPFSPIQGYAGALVGNFNFNVAYRTLSGVETP